MAFVDYLVPLASTDDTEIITEPGKQGQNKLSFLERIAAHNSLIDADGHFDIQKYFHLRGWHISSFGDCEENNCVSKLADEMAQSYEECRAFYKFLRSTITKKQFQFAYSLTEHADNEKAKIIYIAKRMYDSGILINFTSKKDEVIYAKISNAPKVINFVNGKFLEVMAVQKTLDMLERICEYHDCGYDVFPNTHIISNGKEHELDIVFYFDAIVFWVEVKSGGFTDYNQYRELGIEIGVNPNRHLLLTAEISDEDSDAVGWFYECYVANIGNFDKKIQQMIEMALIEEGKI